MSQVYQIVTDRIIAKLTAGVVPWRQPWANFGMPRNLATGKEYRGINVFLLASAGYSDPRWLTFNQARECGFSVRKGEKGMPCVFWQKGWDRKSDDGDTEHVDRLILRYYTVFNAAQLAGDVPTLVDGQRQFAPIDACERVVSEIPDPRPGIEHAGGRAFYSPASDAVTMPARDSFVGPEAYYSTLFHELSHATGHASRLDRKGITQFDKFGSAQYAREELIAEMGAAFLCGQCGIEQATLDNSAAYIASWIRTLRGDPMLAVTAAAQAQKASDWLLGKTFATVPA